MTSITTGVTNIRWQALQCHPAFSAPAVQVHAGIARHEDSLALSYEITGNVSLIKIPAPASSTRQDELWRHTCAELFITTGESTAYTEYNFSPSSQWAAYSFSDYRQDMKVLATKEPEIVRTADQSRLIIAATIVIPEQYRNVSIIAGLSMVIENIDGACSYWALCHDSTRPDFHRRENWICSLQQYK